MGKQEDDRVLREATRILQREAAKAYEEAAMKERDEKERRKR